MSTDNFFSIHKQTGYFELDEMECYSLMKDMCKELLEQNSNEPEKPQPMFRCLNGILRIYDGEEWEDSINIYGYCAEDIIDNLRSCLTGNGKIIFSTSEGKKEISIGDEDYEQEQLREDEKHILISYDNNSGTYNIVVQSLDLSMIRFAIAEQVDRSRGTFNYRKRMFELGQSSQDLVDFAKHDFDMFKSISDRIEASMKKIV